MVGAVYDRALDLTPAGSAGLTGGTITNLVAIDAHKVFELAQEGHQIWSCPLAMVIVTVLLLFGARAVHPGGDGHHVPACAGRAHGGGDHDARAKGSGLHHGQARRGHHGDAAWDKVCQAQSL